MRVLLTGANGQLGHALIAAAPADVQLLPVTRNELNIAELTNVLNYVCKFSPDVIINAAAYTAVDKAESDAAAAERDNVEGPRNLALALAELPSTRLIHVSTDFVFDGKQSIPYSPESTTAPLGVYGQTKLAGERAIVDVLASRSLVVRTAWVYDAQGKNFLRTMLRLMNERGVVSVVADQVGTPTCTHSLAQVLWLFAEQTQLSGIYHWTDAGVASWYDFAVAIAEEAVAIGILTTMPQVKPIDTHEYPTPARRPAYSVLDKSATYTALGLVPVHWRARLREVMEKYSK